MATFVLYNYRFEKLPQDGADIFENVLKPVNPDESFEKRQEIFGNIFKDDFSGTKKIVIENRKKRILSHRQLVDPKEEVYVLQIQNQRAHTVEKIDYNKEKDFEYPSVHVIFDNRDGVQRLAIQKRRKAFTDVKSVAFFLLNALNKILKRYGLVVFFDQQLDCQTFWQIANDRKKYPKGFRKIHFYLPPLNIKRQEAVVVNMVNWARGSYGSSFDWGVEAPDGGSLTINDKDEGQVRVIKVMSEQFGGEKSIKLVPNGTSNKAVWVGKNNFVLDSIEDEILSRLAGNGESELFQDDLDALSLVKIFMKRKIE